MSEGTTAEVMIDANEKLILKPLQAGALDTIALQDDGRFVVAIDRVGLQHAIGEGQCLIDAGDGVVQKDRRLFAHGP